MKPLPRNQRGMILIVSLIMLLLLTVVASPR
jgi:Tfp pilus assembly protein PilX